eukprot:SAG22_NODE_19873_length_271_cov_0.569767_1_plen_26_part_01
MDEDEEEQSVALELSITDAGQMTFDY